MNELGNRKNILYSTFCEKPVLVYEDHRTLLLVLRHAIDKNVINKGTPPNLFCFDRHDDGRDLSEDVMKQVRKYRKDAPTLREFSSFVEWDLSPLDDDWLKVALELGFINDVILVGTQDGNNFTNFNNNYEDHTGLSHRVWRMGYIWNELEYQGKLADTAIHSYSCLWNALGWTIENGEFDFLSTRERDVLVDFDLDCFTVSIDGNLLAWPEDLIINCMKRKTEYLPTRKWSAQRFIKELIFNSPFTTIARESECMANSYESQLILMALDELYWNNDMFRRG